VFSTESPEADKSLRPWFTRDEPIPDLSVADAFGHAAVSQALARAVLEASPPFTLGIFGEWGVGKTTVAKEQLRSAIQGEARRRNLSATYAYFDVWKYEEDSLRRAFLQDVAAQLAEGGHVRNYDPEKKLTDLVWDVQTLGPERVRFSGRRLFRALLLALLTSAATWVLLRVAEMIFELPPRQKIVTTLLAGLAVFVLKEFADVLVVGESNLVRRSLDSPEMFEEKFSELMNHVQPDRVVIVIDNLDRCANDRVVEVLGTIKTFLEPVRATRQPIFVIPCSARTIRQQIETGAGLEQDDADEFLRKFFNAGLEINPSPRRGCFPGCQSTGHSLEETARVPSGTGQRE
jgi:Cdc6-like AAA superfamily ATPase